VTACVVAVDVGNSAIKLCARRHEQAEHDDLEPSPYAGSDPLGIDPVAIDPVAIDHVIPLSRSDWDRSVIDWAGKQLGCHDLQWRIASVHRAAAEHLCQAIAAAQPAAAVHRVAHRHVPMKVRVDHPDQLGIDRLLAAHAAQRRFGSPLVVVDAGSAVTVDWVDPQGDFCGGAILPGLALQLAVLANGTDALPQLEPLRTGSLGQPAKNTADAIRLGVLTGVVATIERLADEFSRVVATSQPKNGLAQTGVILTGGDAPLISSLLQRPHRLVENLVCRGLLDLPRSAFRATNLSDELN
jgi:type III pantothenate kinase